MGGLLRGWLLDYVTQTVERMIHLLPFYDALTRCFFFRDALNSSEGMTDLYYDPNQVGSVSTSTRQRMLTQMITSPTHDRVRTVLPPTFINEKVGLLKVYVEGDEQAILEDLDRS
jgi:hypothetical protein